MGLSRTWNVPDEFWILWWRSREHRQLVLVARGRYETGTLRGLSGVYRRPVDQGTGAGVVAGVVSGQSAHRGAMKVVKM